MGFRRRSADAKPPLFAFLPDFASVLILNKPKKVQFYVDELRMAGYIDI
jgi:hypothetical protein